MMIFMFFSTKMHIQHFGMKISTSIRFTITESEVSLSHSSFLQSKLIIATRMEKFELSAHPAFVPPLHLCPKWALFLISSLWSSMWPPHRNRRWCHLLSQHSGIPYICNQPPKKYKICSKLIFCCRTGWNQSYQDMIINLNVYYSV